MRSIVHDRFGEPSEVLRVTEVPDPAAPGPGEVLIRVTTRPVHPGDLAGIRGRYTTDHHLPAPVTPGMEGVGTVEALGDGIGADSGLTVGGRVAFFPVPGGWGERVVAPRQFVTPVPDTVTDVAASQLMVKPITAAMLLRAAEEAGLSADSGLLVQTAAGSGVGRLVTAMALSRGFATVSVVRSATGAAVLRETFDVPVLSTDDNNWVARLREAAGSRPVQVAVDPIGGAISVELTGLLADGGTLLTYGGLAEGEPMGLDAMTLTSRGLTVRGVTIGRWLISASEALRGQDIDGALKLAQERPDLFDGAAEYDLAHVTDAVQHMERSGKTGTVLLSSPSA
ncbi:zinc-binding dehydrogenase [Streptomyces sp. NBC_00316]|uniref:zinc-binding dehydrogenase n=1 Tax=Streptomyces sp. NBC_00316 TaxID=2975710 RepID=UPI002E29DAC4|nr:zinc-binding dehydrogenase [Streptomyces sp. NBC_00316]